MSEGTAVALTECGLCGDLKAIRGHFQLCAHCDDAVNHDSKKCFKCDRVAAKKDYPLWPDER